MTIEKNSKYQRSLASYGKAESLFPFGVQLLSRSPQLSAFGQAPIYFDHAKDGHFWDVDGNEFIDLSMGCGPIILGYAYEPVDSAAKAQIDRGVLGSTNNEIEIKFAEKVCEMVPCAEMIKICKGGGEADSIAVRMARGYTGRDVVVFCGYHGWFDWYLAANLEADDRLDEHLRPGILPKGVPGVLAGTSVPFEYNNLESLRAALKANQGKVACIVLEATREQIPAPGFLETVRALADEHDCLLIFDEVVTGFRIAPGGAQEHFGVTPDLATFGKAVANGYPLAVVAGRKSILATQFDNFISSTYYSETVSLAAGLATLNEITEKPVLKTVAATGKKVMAGLEDLARSHGLQVQIRGHDYMFNAGFDYGSDTGRVSTLFMQEMAARGVYVTGHFYFCYTHTAEDVDKVLAATDETFGVMAEAINGNRIDDVLKAPERKVVFKRRLA
jgi:glutamate-1-semialdehyde aminotransferase